MKRDEKLRLGSIVVIGYIIAAFVWWAWLLFRKNHELFEAKYKVHFYEMLAGGLVGSEPEFLRSEVYLDLFSNYRRQMQMIAGEGVVFVLSLILGIWFINNGYRKEVASSRQRRNFLLSITHELKSPIAGIQLAIETLLKRELPRDKSERLLGNALAETSRLKRLVNDLLFSAKLESAYQPHKEPIDMAALFDNIVEGMRAKYPKAEFLFSVSGELPVFLGDQAGLSSVAHNLLENAVKYSPEPARVEMRLEARSQFIRLEVADNGHGIPEKERQKIFAKFYRLGNEDTRKTKGTGLGLYIVEQIVKVHRGTIAVLDNEPAGTVFRIDLPVPKS